MRKLAFVLCLAVAAGLAACSAKKVETPAAAPDGGAASTAQKPTTIPAPPDVAAPPADAEKSASGLAWKVLQKGTGTEHPGPYDTVTVHYTGWTTDGKMFDSSVTRGQTVSFPLNAVIKGWTEGVQLMVVGEKRRFWIPADLAYGNQPGRPAGMLVFDIELLGIKPGPKPPESVGEPPKDAEKVGEIYVKVVKAGTGAKVTKDSILKLQYSAWAGDGKLLASTSQQGRPALFKLESAPPGIKEGLSQASQGDERILWIPRHLIQNLGPPDAKGDWFTFDTIVDEVLDVTPPPDVKAPPKDAEKTPSGLASIVLKRSTSKEHPTAESTVRVNYTGWTTDGKMFDSSALHGGPAQFKLNAVIPGWTEGLQLMTRGEKRRFWIPAELAYKGKPGPQGTLVFDVELLDIVDKK